MQVQSFYVICFNEREGNISKSVVEFVLVYCILESLLTHKNILAACSPIANDYSNHPPPPLTPQFNHEITFKHNYKG